MRIFVFVICLLGMCSAVGAREIMLSTATESKPIQTTSIIESVRVTKDTVQVDVVTTVIIDGLEPQVRQNMVTLANEDYDGFIEGCDIDFDKIETYIKAYTDN